MIGLTIRTLVIIMLLAAAPTAAIRYAVMVCTAVTTVCGIWLAYGEPPNLIMKANLDPYIDNAFFLRYCAPIAIASYLVVRMGTAVAQRLELPGQRGGSPPERGNLLLQPRLPLLELAKLVVRERVAAFPAPAVTAGPRPLKAGFRPAPRRVRAPDLRCRSAAAAWDRRCSTSERR